jgi:transcriptional regulator with XRE-family HTH domain
MLEELVLKLREYSREEICYKAGISIGVLNKIMSGANDNPTLKTITKLQTFIEEKENELSCKGK